MRQARSRAAALRGGLASLLCAILFCAVLPWLSGCTDSPDGAISQADVEVEALPPLEEVSAIRDLALTPAGGVWILNTAAPRLLLQHRDGRLVTAFGRTGEGPQQLGFPAAIVEASDTSVTVHDRKRNALRTFDLDGVEVASTPLEGVRTLVPSDLDYVLAGSPFLTTMEGTLTEGALLLSDFPEARRPGTAHLWNRQIVRVRPEPAVVEVIADFREERDRFAEELSGASILVPAPLWASCPDGTVALYMPFRNEVRWMGGRAVVSTPESPRPLASREVVAAVRGRITSGPQPAPMSESEIEAAIPMAVRQLGSEMSSTAPAYVEMACGYGSVAWLQRFSVEHDWLGRGEEIDLVWPDGRLMRLRVPRGFRLLRFDGDTLLGVLRDAFDVEQPGLLRVDRVLIDTMAP